MKITNLTSSELFAHMSDTQKDDIYRMIWFSHVIEDVKGKLIERFGIDELSEEDEALCNDVANAYVYNGKYDCNQSYWDNINNLINEYSTSTQRTLELVDTIKQEIQTNMGTMPKEDYKEIVAMQHGFDSYEEMVAAGYSVDR